MAELLEHGYHHPSETRNLVGAYTRENEMLTDVSLSLPARARKLAAAKRAARKRMNLRKKNLLKKTLHKKKRN
ncbi:hypothetical protein RB195_016315 [Necator americanus]|uniref:Uncharacterized protein n=1 Tax=Necator americanus TaxID=51031 RepID=A0ABR1E8L2_NECAM